MDKDRSYSGRSEAAPGVPQKLIWNGEASSLRAWRRELKWWMGSTDLSDQLDKNGKIRYSLAQRVVNARSSSRAAGTTTRWYSVASTPVSSGPSRTMHVRSSASGSTRP